MRRTLRKPTRWTPEEWAQIEAAAHACGVPPTRYVREAALGHPLTPSRGRDPRATDATRRGNDVMNQLGRVLNNLRQLARIAEIDDDMAASQVLADSARSVEDAIARAPAALKHDADATLATLIEAGVALNVLARRANGTDQLPPSDELRPVLVDVLAAVEGIVR